MFERKLLSFYTIQMKFSVASVTKIKEVLELEMDASADVALISSTQTQNAKNQKTHLTTSSDETAGPFYFLL